MLKRFSFSEKVRICNRLSRELINIYGDIDIEKFIHKVYPWELETFFMIAMKGHPEYKENSFDCKGERVFIKIINGIRHSRHPELDRREGTVSFADYLMASLMLAEYDSQEIQYYKLYRYKYIFSYVDDKIDMQEAFLNKFGTSYDDFLELGVFITFLYGIQKDFEAEILDCVLKDFYPVAFSKLCISVEEYKNILDSVTNMVEDYSTCLRPSFKYPFVIKEDLIYFPLPHLFIRANTSSLFYRLTDGDDNLRKRIGKHVLEKYLFKILSESRAYDELYEEKEYLRERHNKAVTLDVMAKDGNDYLFLDCKSMVPSIGMRIYDENRFNKELEILSTYFVQVYKNIKEFLPRYESYNPFKGAPVIEDEYLWGVVVVLEDNFIRRSLIIEKAAEALGVLPDTAEYTWMSTHIKVVSMYDVERWSFAGESIVRGLIKQENEGKPGDYALNDYNIEEDKIKNENYKMFRQDLGNRIISIVMRLKQ